MVTPDMGCGVVSSGSSLYFSKVKQLQKIGMFLVFAFLLVISVSNEVKVNRLKSVFEAKLCRGQRYK